MNASRLPAMGAFVRPSVYGMLIALPLSVAGVNFFSALTVLLVLLSREWWQAGARLLSQPVIWVVLSMLGMLGLGMIYSMGSTQEALAVLAKYRKLALVPLLLPFFQDDRHRILAMRILAGAIFFTVLMSWSEYLGWTHVSDPAYFNDSPPGDAVFKMHIPQGTLFSLLLAMSLGMALTARSALSRAGYLVVALMAGMDIAWVMTGRTGKALLPFIVLWALWEGSRAVGLTRLFRAIAIGLSIVLLGTTSWMLTQGDTKLGSIANEIRQSRQTGAITSQGMRVEFYRKAAELISERPVTGYGTGSVRAATEVLANQASTEVARSATTNLHNEFLMWTVQFGWAGLTALLLLFFLVWRASFAQALPVGILLRGQWVVLLLGCLFNSYLLDFAEGHALVLAVAILLPL